MESIEDDVILPIPHEPLSPIYKPKLKRLKKSSSSAAADSVRVYEAPIVPNEDSKESAASESKDLDEKVDFGDDLDPLFSVPSDDPTFPSSDSPISGSKEVGGEKEADGDLDPLFSVPAADEGFETLDLERESEEDGGFKDTGDIESGVEKEKSVKKRLNMDEGSEEISKKRRKKKSKDADKLGEKSKESVRKKKRTEKERMAMLEHMHAESQRLLRETRDASFKPVPVVQKPISSVLEKIRLRKLEILKQTSFLCQPDSAFTSDCSVDELAEKNSESVKIQNDSRYSVGDAEVAAGSKRSPRDPFGEIPFNNASDLELKDASPALFNEPQALKLEDASPTAIGEAQEAAKDNQSKHGDNSQLDDLDESFKPPLSTSELNPTSDDLSSEEDNDKENNDPCPSSAVNVVSSPERGLAKVFLDDEAEEEDDSDNDRARFQDNEEDDESDEDEVFDDLIATGYEEAPTDCEKRNRLHQKWLEQQDAAGTDDILQRLKYGQKQKEPSCLHDDDDDNEIDDDFDEESAGEKSHDPPVADVARQNSKKAKQMIAQMFTDADDSYVHSDDEESEQTLHRQRILKHTGESSFISPVEDENSREIFGLIKKLNIAPVTKKRGKTVTSSFDSLMMGTNSNNAKMSSFLNRTSTSLPSLHRQTSTTVRAFIFGRDDSNSRSGITAPESIPDMEPKENHSVKPAASKVNNSSQLRSTAKTKAKANSSSTSGSSLFQILRQSSVQFDRQTSKKRTSCPEVTETQAAYQFSAFKLGKRPAKMESRI